MRFGNTEKFNILTSLDDPFDIESFKQKCLDKEMFVQGTVAEYAQKVGMYLMSKKMYPELNPLDAYLKLATSQETNTVIQVGNSTSNETPPGCGGCGGGEVR